MSFGFKVPYRHFRADLIYVCECVWALFVSSCQTKAKGLQTSETWKKGWRHIQLTSSAQDFKGRSCGYLDGDLVSDRHTTPYGPPQHEIQGHPRLGVMQPWYAKCQAQTWYDDILHGNAPSTCFILLFHLSVQTPELHLPYLATKSMDWKEIH
jgi:hypothetical protein